MCDQWRDISTAPNGGEPILVYGGRHEHVQVAEADGDWWRSEPKLRATPTHWMPMPVPPNHDRQHMRVTFKGKIEI